MIVLGVDPGQNIGWTALDIHGAAARWIASGVARQLTIEPGRILFDGDAVVLTGDCAPALIVVESVNRVYPRERFCTNMATAIATAERVCGQVLGAAAAALIPTEEVAAGTWRSALAGRANADDALVKKFVLARVTGWPRRSASHARDAAGAAIYGAMRHSFQQLIRRAAKDPPAAT